MQNQTAPPALSPQAMRILPWLVAITFFMQNLDITIVNTALPSMAVSLNTNPLQMQAVVIGYILTVALLIPASGWLTDRFGTRQIFLFAIALFTLGSLACALSPSLPILVASRVLQGLGGALLTPVGRLTVLKAFPRDQLVQVLSFITVPGLIGPLLGPTLGGVIVEYAKFGGILEGFASWRWIFLINLPVGLVAGWATLRHMPDLPGLADPPTFDWVGFTFFGTAMLSITMAFEGVGELHLAHTPMLLLFIFGIISLVVYCLHALRTPKLPLFSPAIFKTRNFAVGIMGNLFARLGNGAMPFLTPLLLQVGLGYTPLRAGLTMIPLALAAIVAKRFIRPILNFLGYRWFLCINTLALGILIASFSFIDKQTTPVELFLLFALFGTVNSMQFTVMNTLTLIDLPNNHAASGNGLLSVVMQVSMGMGIACAAAILEEFSEVRIGSQSANLLNAFHNTYLCLGFMAALSSCIFFHARHSTGKKCETE